MSGIDINGEIVSERDAQAALRMLMNDAKRFAGEFHNMNRSAKFRANWPNEDKFAASEWRNFIEAVHGLYAEQLGKPNVSEHDKKLMHRAIVLWKMTSRAGELMTGRTNNILQIMPGTQQFEGDKTENCSIVEKFGTTRNLRAYLKNSTAQTYH
jgi:hypothetical protein